MNARTTAAIQSALKTHQPASVRVVLVDETTRILAPGSARARWVPVLQALAELPWSQLELRDAKDRTLGAPLYNEGAADALESLRPGEGSTALVQVQGLMREVQASTASNLRWFTSTLEPTLTLASQLAKESASGVEYWRKEAESQRDARLKLEAKVMRLELQLGKLVEAHERDDDDSWVETLKEISEAAPQLAQLAGLGLRMLSSVTSKAAPAAPRPAPKAVP